MFLVVISRFVDNLLLILKSLDQEEKVLSDFNCKYIIFADFDNDSIQQLVKNGWMASLTLPESIKHKNIISLSAAQISLFFHLIYELNEKYDIKIPSIKITINCIKDMFDYIFVRSFALRTAMSIIIGLVFTGICLSIIRLITIVYG